MSYDWTITLFSRLLRCCLFAAVCSVGCLTAALAAEEERPDDWTPERLQHFLRMLESPPPPLTVEQARQQAEQTHRVFTQARRRAEQANERVGRVLLNGPDSAYDQVNAHAERALDQMTEALEHSMAAEDLLYQALQYRFGDDEALWQAWSEWETWKRTHTRGGQ